MARKNAPQQRAESEAPKTTGLFPQVAQKQLADWAQDHDNAGHEGPPISGLRTNLARVPVQRKGPRETPPNRTGLPDRLKSGIEQLSGYAMDDVRVHYNSPKPTQVRAHAYTQGTNIHVAPGQQKHLPHEAWHVVQQKQGRVKPTLQMKDGVNINDDMGLEKEADTMGMKADEQKEVPARPSVSLAKSTLANAGDLVQLTPIRVWWTKEQAKFKKLLAGKKDSNEMNREELSEVIEFLEKDSEGSKRSKDIATLKEELSKKVSRAGVDSAIAAPVDVMKPKKESKAAKPLVDMRLPAKAAPTATSDVIKPKTTTRPPATKRSPTEAAPASDKPMGVMALARWKMKQGNKINAMKHADAKSKARAELEDLVLKPLSEAELSSRFDATLKELEGDKEAKASIAVAAEPDKPVGSGTTDPTTEQFGKTAEEGGGLLMRGIADSREMDVFLESIPEAETKQEKLKERKHNLEKYSYIRSDTTMRPFGGRNMGFLIDWTKVSDHVLLTDKGELAISEEDVQSGTMAKPKTVADDPKLKQRDVAEEFDALVTRSNKTKETSPGKVGNWNEVQILTANPDAYIGLFYAWPSTKEDYDATFTEARKKELAKKWFEKTDQRELKIYVYKHRGNPKLGTPESKEAVAALGKVGASELYLMETIPYEEEKKE